MSTLLATAMVGCGTSSNDKDTNTGANQPGVTQPTGGAPMGGAPMGMTPGVGAPGVMTPVTMTPGMTAGTTGGVAGSGAPMTPTEMMPTDMEPTPTEGLDGRGKCEINSGFPNDEACLLPPAPGEGFQIHVGPKNYQDMAEVNAFVFEPNNESSECWSFHTPNTEDAYWQTFELSGRAGTHHIINTMFATDQPDGTTFTGCGDPGTGTNPDIIGNLPGASKAYMPRMKIAPENAMLGRKVPAKAFAQADMHYFNFTDKTVLREFWLNIYTVPKDKITGETNQIRAMGGLSWSAIPIPMGEPTLYQYQTDPLDQDGRIIAFLGHYHAHGKRFAAYISRGGQDTKVFEMYDYLDPKIFNYDSITTNPEFGPESAMQAGASSGILEVKAGDIIKWECLIHNDDQPGGLRYTNEVKTGEMCNLWGESVGPVINVVRF